jgi:hypothetical protein
MVSSHLSLILPCCNFTLGFPTKYLNGCIHNSIYSCLHRPYHAVA